MASALIASGILLSRLLGVVRESLKARYLGASETIVADAFNAAMRIPNILNNLFGEGALSASFIPVYSNLLARGDRKEADRVAGAIGAFLGVWLGGLAMEQTGSFLPVWWAGIVLAVIAAGLHWPIVERPAPSFAASAQSGA